MHGLLVNVGIAAEKNLKPGKVKLLHIEQFSEALQTLLQIFRISNKLKRA